jgi:hypothetical protein
VARAQNTVSRVPAVPTPVACGLLGTAAKPLGTLSVTGSPPALSTKSRAMSLATWAGHAGLAPMPVVVVPLTAVPAAW